MVLAEVGAALVLGGACATAHPPARPPARPAPTSSASDAIAAPSAEAAAPPTERRRRVLARGGSYGNPTSMVVDERAVYATTGGANVLEIPRDGSGKSTPVFANATVAGSLAIDAHYLYVASGATYLVPSEGAVIRVDKRTKAPEVIARHRVPRALSVDATGVWFGDEVQPGAWRVAKTGGKPLAVAGIRGTVSAIDHDEARVYFAATEYAPVQRGAVYVAPMAGGKATVLVDGLTDAMGVAVYDGAVWYNDNGKVMMLPPGGGAPSTISDRGSTIAFARRTSALFWCAVSLSDASGHVGAIERAERGPMAVSVEPAPVGVAADEISVFFADAFTGEVVALEF